MKVAVILAVSLGVLAVVKAQEMPMKAPKLPLAEMQDEHMPLPEARGEMMEEAQPDKMQRRGGGDKGGSSNNQQGWGWGPPPMPMGWGWGAPMGWGMGGGYGGGMGGYGRR